LTPRGPPVKASFEPIRNTLEEFGAFVKEDIARWAKLVKETGAKVE
jgi:tripartite-type tricarboxylate transporter receptor subunit TctC